MTDSEEMLLRRVIYEALCDFDDGVVSDCDRTSLVVERIDKEFKLSQR